MAPPPDTKVSPRLRVLIADDHQPMLDSLARVLAKEFEVVATAKDGADAVDAARRCAPDLLVLDIAMPRLNGIAAATQLRADGSTAKVVFVTMHYDREFVQRALELGEVGFVAKDRLVIDLLPAIRAVQAGQSFVSPSLAR